MVGAAGEKGLRVVSSPVKGTKGAGYGTEWKTTAQSRHMGRCDLGPTMNEAVVELFEERKDFLSVYLSVERGKRLEGEGAQIHKMLMRQRWYCFIESWMCFRDPPGTITQNYFQKTPLRHFWLCTEHTAQCIFIQGDWHMHDGCQQWRNSP